MASICVCLKTVHTIYSIIATRPAKVRTKYSTSMTCKTAAALDKMAGLERLSLLISNLQSLFLFYEGTHDLDDALLYIPQSFCHSHRRNTIMIEPQPESLLERSLSSPPNGRHVCLSLLMYLESRRTRKNRDLPLFKMCRKIIFTILELYLSEPRVDDSTQGLTTRMFRLLSLS